MGCLWYDLMKAVKGNSAMMEALLDAIPKKVDNTTGTGHEHGLYTLPPYLQVSSSRTHDLCRARLLLTS